LFDSQAQLLSSRPNVVDLYLETTCSGSISETAYQSLMCLEQSADKIDQKLILHLKNRVMQGSILVTSTLT